MTRSRELRFALAVLVFLAAASYGSSCLDRLRVGAEQREIEHEKACAEAQDQCRKGAP